jgi:hypothetical protein
MSERLIVGFLIGKPLRINATHKAHVYSSILDPGQISGINAVTRQVFNPTFGFEALIIYVAGFQPKKQFQALLRSQASFIMISWVKLEQWALRPQRMAYTRLLLKEIGIRQSGAFVIMLRHLQVH